MLGPVASLLQQAAAANRRGAIGEACVHYRRVLEFDPDNEIACTNLAAIAVQAGRLDEAETMFRRIVALRPNSAQAQYNLGFVLQERGRLDAAEAAYRRAIVLSPDLVEAYNNLGVVLQEEGKLEESIIAFRQAIVRAPHRVDAHFNLGVVLALVGDIESASSAYRRALELDPDHVRARNNLSLTLCAQGEFKAVQTLQRQLLAKHPDNAEAHNNLAAALLDEGKPAEALEALRHALRLKSDYPEAQLNLGNALRELGRLDEAIDAYGRAVELRPSYGAALAQLVYHCARACDWTDTVAQERLLAAVRQGAPGIPPFSLLTTAATAADLLLCARNWAKNFAVPDQQVFRHRATARPGRLRIGYLSSDFHDHATAYLIAELIERHDRCGFEIHGYSYGPDHGGAARARLIAAFDRFTDIDALSHRQAAERIRQDDIDILVDLKGYTHRSRPKILAFRPAPVQVNYLGFPGSMGAAFIDYAVVDDFIVPPGRESDFAEALAYLPHCYQPNDTRRDIGAVPARAACGLPPQGFVFCAFHNSFKISPTFVAIWMRLLQNVPGSVLWLLESNSSARRNLTAAAVAHGVDPARLIFAPMLPQREHLARQGNADLFLDTLPCNAHTTASDALWSGLPVVTCAGETFAGRVAGSILRAAGLAELITRSARDYEALALSLAHDPAWLDAIRSRLKQGRASQPLFDMGQRTRDLETIYSRMDEAWRSGKTATAIVIDRAGRH
jgi:predicted O-linked N-acetylglucosamine transferase (SPINDLY family)